MAILVFIIGIMIGSFLNVCIYRIPRKESIAFGASHCTKCGNRIKWYDLIPVISYLILGGKCRNCKERISIQYPCVELINGLAYFGLYYAFKLEIWFYIACIILSSAIVLFGILFNKNKNTIDK